MHKLSQIYQTGLDQRMFGLFDHINKIRFFLSKFCAKI